MESAWQYNTMMQGMGNWCGGHYNKEVGMMMGLLEAAWHGARNDFAIKHGKYGVPTWAGIGSTTIGAISQLPMSLRVIQVSNHPLTNLDF